MKTIFKTILALLLVVGLFFANAFFGNPISRLIVSYVADKYIEETYAQRDFERGKIFYNFKDASYNILLQDKKSQDTKFEIAFDSLGRFHHDDYPYILFNTWRRFSQALDQYGKELAEKNSKSYKIFLTIDDEMDLETLRLDQEVDLANFPLQVSAGLETFVEKPSFSQTLDFLKDLDELMSTTPLKVKNYSIILIPEKDRAEDGQAQSLANAISIFDIGVDTVKKGSAKDLEALKNTQGELKKDVK
ncbi:MAG: hypothetical protein Q4E50_05135 [Tissierellia bacterium]|nr:hypothetical protein [Tissierellia bacterium]